MDWAFWLVASAAVAVSQADGTPASGPNAPGVMCRVREDPRGREYRLENRTRPEGFVWTLSMREGREGRWIDLALPGASPRFAPETMELEYRNANGGRQIEMVVGPGGSRLDLYVDYGLDVNIDPDLDPAVDEMNTEGPLTSLDCTLLQP